MRIGVPSVDGGLVAAGLAAVVLTANLVHQTRDTGAAQSPSADVSTARGDRLPVLVVAAMDSPADLAVGQPVAEAVGGALLAVDATGLTQEMTARLSRSRPDQVLVLGGPAAVAEATAAALGRYTPGSVTRLAGADRFATAAMVAESQFASPVRQVRIVSGDVAAVPSSSPKGDGADTPVLLIESDRLPASTAAALRELRPRRIEVLGGSSAVSDEVLEQLQTFTSGPVVRP